MMRHATKESFDTIMDTFATAGTPFVKLLMAVRQFDAQAEAGDEAAQKIIELVHQFSRLINACQKL